MLKTSEKLLMVERSIVEAQCVLVSVIEDEDSVAVRIIMKRIYDQLSIQAMKVSLFREHEEGKECSEN